MYVIIYLSIHLIHPSIYQSIYLLVGTTGKPKGVELSHENIVANVKGQYYCIASLDAITIDFAS